MLAGWFCNSSTFDARRGRRILAQRSHFGSSYLRSSYLSADRGPRVALRIHLALSPHRGTLSPIAFYSGNMSKDETNCWQCSTPSCIWWNCHPRNKCQRCGLKKAWLYRNATLRHSGVANNVVMAVNGNIEDTNARREQLSKNIDELTSALNALSPSGAHETIRSQL